MSTTETTQEEKDSPSLDSEFTFAKGGIHQAQSTGFLSVVRHKHCKTVSAAIGLLVIGLTFISVSGVQFAKGESTRGLAFFIVGVLCTIPGAYQTYLLYHIWKRTPGYRFSQIPSYDEEEDDEEEYQ